MGRGRAKAKQTKVARELKYSTRPLDPRELEAELRGGNRATDEFDDYEEVADYEDPYAAPDEDEPETPRRR